MSGAFAVANPRRIKAAHRRRRKVASGPIVQRYYDPSIGGFLSVDPVAVDTKTAANFCRYCYANNNPYKFTDPDGRNAVTALGGLIHETGQFLQGNGFDGGMVAGALADGYNGQGDGFASAAFQDATTFVPAGAVAGAAIKLSRMASQAAKVANVAKAADKAVPSLKTIGKIENQLKTDGLKSVLKSQQKLERRLSEHTEKLGQIKEAGGHTSSVQREITGFQKELNAIKEVLGKNK